MAEPRPDAFEGAPEEEDLERTSLFVRRSAPAPEANGTGDTTTPDPVAAPPQSPPAGATPFGTQRDAAPGSSPQPPVFGARPAPPTTGPAGPPRRLPEHRGSASRWRAVSIPTRFLVVALCGVLLVALVSVALTLTVSRVGDLADDSADLADARRHNAEAAGLLRELELATRADLADGGTDELVRRQAIAVARLDGSLGAEPELARQAVAVAADGDAVVEALDDTPEGEAPSADTIDALDEVLASRQTLEDELAVRQGQVRDDLAAARTAAVGAALVLAVVAAVALPLLGRALGRSVVGPLRDLGRAMRRFGDGDLRVRTTEGGDEVGALAKSFNVLAGGAGNRIRHLSADAERGSQLRVIAEALELATDEDDVHRIVEHALAILVPETPAELLVSDEDGSRLRQVAVSPTTGPPNCPVPDATGCVAIRRGQVVSFDAPDALNACPWLRDRAKGPCSATCVPATAGGHLLGVLHSTGPVGEPPGRESVEQMVTIMSQASTRIGALRTLESTRTLASTDTLTGLANRRTLETELGDLIRTGTPFVLAVVDIDHFKALNDTYGHELGDRALQLFATVLAENVRGHDVVARFGGEEFVLVYPHMDLRRSMEVIDRIRAALARATEEAGLPSFTASFGVTHSSVAGDVETIVRIADAGLLLAKEQGRDRVVYSDAEVTATVFDGPRDHGARRSPPSVPPSNEPGDSEGSRGRREDPFGSRGGGATF